MFDTFERTNCSVTVKKSSIGPLYRAPSATLDEGPKREGPRAYSQSH